jgi:hypothetical protein
MKERGEGQEKEKHEVRRVGMTITSKRAGQGKRGREDEEN